MMLCKRFYFLVTALILFSGFCPVMAKAADSLVVVFNKEQFKTGDSITADIYLPGFTKETNAVTLQLWIENIATHQRWKYRYPLINGYTNMALKIDENIKDGMYAFNFLIQDNFFNINGKVANAGKKDTSLIYIMVARDKESLFKKVALNPDKSFKIRRLLFQDTAFFVFAREKQSGNNDLEMRVTTSLDSAFNPSAVVTRMIRIGNPDSSQALAAAPYHFSIDEKDFRGMLPEVTVTAKGPKLVDKFDQENSSGLFRSADAIILDGLDSDEMSRSVNIYTYIISKVPGLRLEKDDQTGTDFFTWRNAHVQIYINEFRLDRYTPLDINPADVAMIKVFRPGYSLTGNAGGAIAIYTRTGSYERPGDRKYSFYIRGYNALESNWH